MQGVADKYDLVVIGGGPAGLLASGRAASLGSSVLLLESMEKPARKLRISGKGRCNITNTKPIEEFMEGIYPEPRFLRNAFAEFFSNDIVELLNNLGVQTVEERGQRVFPASGKAWDVAEALVRWAVGLGVTVRCKSRVTRIQIFEGRVSGVEYISKGGAVQLVNCQGAVLATGGKSYPATGSTGDGYRLASECGHTIVEPTPTLVGVETQPTLRGAEGLTLRNVSLSLWVEGKRVGQEFGEVEITPYGLSGPITIRLSRRMVALLHRGTTPELTLDLKPALSPEKLDARIQREIQSIGRGSVNDLLRKLIPKQLIDPFAYHAGLAMQKPVARLTSIERKSIVQWLKGVTLEVIGHRDWPEAIATAGGVSLKEVNPRTLESKRVGGLYFAGELLDLDGDTGGYNLQIAFSTGWVAGGMTMERR